MKAAIANVNEKPEYQKRVITITLESIDEEIGMHHLLNCWGEDSCTNKNQVLEVIKKLEHIKATLVYE